MVRKTPENPRLPIFEQWAERYDQSVQASEGIFASYDLVLAEIVRAARIMAGMRVLDQHEFGGAMSAQNAERAVARLHQCDHTCFAGVGQGIHEERSEAYAQALTRFITTSNGGTP